jgi:hypothetical protein
LTSKWCYIYIDRTKTNEHQIMTNTTRIEHLGLIVTESQTRPTRPGKQPRPVWEVTGRVAGLEDELYGLGCKKWGGKFSFWSDPTDDLMKLTEADRIDFAAQQERKQELAVDRADRYDERAAKHSATGDSLLASADKLSERFSFGQPILIGHHSEKGARRDQEKMWNKTRAGYAEKDYSSHLAGKADSALAHADRVHGKEYIGNRIDDAKKAIREIDRRLADFSPEGRLKSLADSQVQADWYTRNNEPLCERVAGAIAFYSDEHCHDGNIVRFTQARADQQEKLDYWAQQMTDLGGTVYGKDNVKTGDFIRLDKMYWYRVYRSNPQTASTHYFSHEQGFANPVKWARVVACRTGAEMAAMIEAGTAVYAGGEHRASDVTPQR